MRLLRMTLNGHRSVHHLDFEAGPFTVLFGKNNAGKTNILETIYGVFAPRDQRIIRRPHAGRDTNPEGALYAELEPGLVFDDAVAAAVGDEVAVLKSDPVAFARSGCSSVTGASTWTSTF